MLFYCVIMFVSNCVASALPEISSSEKEICIKKNSHHLLLTAAWIWKPRHSSGLWIVFFVCGIPFFSFLKEQKTEAKHYDM